MTGGPAGIVFHVPHASRRIPDEVRPWFVVSDFELATELDRLTDRWTDDLLVPASARDRTVRADVSRFVVDVERFVHDADEPMAARGMGAVYLNTTDGRPLRTKPDPDTRASWLACWYEPHHRRLEEAVDASLARHGRALVLDLHSFPSRPLPCDLDQEPDRPDVCIGTDAFHTPPALRDAMVDSFRGLGLDVAVDRPYAGTIVPTRHFGHDPRVVSVMVEIRRDTYMDEATVRRLPTFERTGRDLRRTLRNAVGRWAACDDRRADPRI